MLSTQVYFSLAFLYTIIGILAASKVAFKNTALKVFLFLTIILPITKFTTAFHTIYQISVYHYFFIGLVMAYGLLLLSKNKIKKFLFQATVLLSFMLAFYALHFLLFVGEDRDVTNILKDSKPIVLILLGIFFIEFYKKRLFEILSRKFVNTLLLSNLICSSLFFFLMVKYNLHLKLTNDPYYQYEELRFENLGSYLGIFYLTFLLYKDQKPSFKELIYCMVPLLFTGNRTLIFSVLLIIALYYLTKLSLQKLYIFFSSLLVIFFSFVLLIQNASLNSPLFRFKKLLSLEYIQYALLNRFSPFIDAVKTFSGLDYVFGKGLGYTFFIPWFHYREEIDNFNIYLDNLYLTLYAKFGVFSIVFFLITFLYLKRNHNFKTSLFYFVFILILSVTNAFFYQNNFLWIFILLAFPFNVYTKQSSFSKIKFKFKKT